MTHIMIQVIVVATGGNADCGVGDGCDDGHGEASDGDGDGDDVRNRCGVSFVRRRDTLTNVAVDTLQSDLVTR